MTPYRQETSMPEGQPVGFYKVIALTFLVITIILLGVIVFSSSKKAVITITTKSDPVEVNIVAGVNSTDEDIKLNGAIATTTIELSKSFVPALTKEVPGKGLTGKMILHNDSPESQALIATTRLQTAEGAIFRIKDKVIVPAKGQIEVMVYFDDKNTLTSNGVGKLTVPGLNLEKQKVIYATNEVPITSVMKVGVISSDDLKNAEQALGEEIKKQAQDKLSARFGEMAGVYLVNNLVVSTTAKVGDETNEFNLHGSAVVLGVFYKADEVATLAKKELNKRIVGDAEILEPSGSAPTVTIKEYSAELNSVKLNIYYNGTVSLNPESKQLQKESFFGKNEQEVRRYLLSLDHVKAVDLKFSPAWTRTVPSLSDHVSVVVKSVE